MHVCGNWPAHALSGENSLRRSPDHERSRPKHAVSEELMTLAEDKKPEANLLIGLSQYASQCHTSLNLNKVCVS